jgi:hypothetical protein
VGAFVSGGLFGGGRVLLSRVVGLVVPLRVFVVWWLFWHLVGGILMDLFFCAPVSPLHYID